MNINQIIEELEIAATWDALEEPAQTTVITVELDGIYFNG